MTFLRTDKMKLSVLIVSFLLLVSAFTFLPAVGAFSPTAVATGSAPATVTGATATIDASVLAGLSAAVTRTISAANPNGNPIITSLTISVPKAAASVGPTSGIISAAISGVPAGVTVSVFGSGPWAVVYTPTSGTTLIPGGATITLLLSFTTEAALTTTGVADSYSLSTSVTDTTGANTVLGSITIYETSDAAGSLTLTGPSSSITAGSNYALTIQSTDSGLPLTVKASGTTTTVSPSTFTSVASPSASSVTFNDTLAGTALTLTVSGGKLATNSAGGDISTAITFASTDIIAGAVTTVAITVLTSTKGQIYNVTSTNYPNAIAGSSISVSTADKFGNAAVFSNVNPTNVVVAANTITGQVAGFSATATYSGTYPYTPTLAPSETVVIGAGSSTTTLTGYYYFYGVDYGSKSQISATATSTSLSAGTSATIQTYTLSSAAVTLAGPVSGHATAGGSFALTATLPTPAQAGVPIWLFNSTDYSSLTATAIEAFTSVSSGTATASWTISAPTLAGTTAPSATTFTAKDVVATATSPITLSNNTASNAVAISTVASSVAEWKLYAFFASPATGFIYGTSPTYYLSGATATADGKTSTVTPGRVVYIDALAADQYGNPVWLPVDTTVTLSTSAGALSVNSVTLFGCGTCVYPTNGPMAIIWDNGVSVGLTAPSTVGTVITVTATGDGYTGSETLTVVTATPNLVVSTAPTTVTAGVPSVFGGVVNASTGICTNAATVTCNTISSIKYSINGGANTTISIGSANAAWTFSVLLSATGANSVVICAIDSQTSPAQGNQVCQSLSVPVVPAALTFTSAGTGLPAQYQFPNGGPQSVATTFTNNGATSITIIVVANIFTSPGGLPETPSPTATATVAAGASTTTYNLLNGLPHGTYTVTVNVYSTQYVSLSPTYTITVTV